MAKIKQIGMAAGTFSVALGIGFVMQNGDALASRFGSESAPQQTAPFTEVVEDAVVSDVVSGLEAPEMTDTDVEPIAVVQSGVVMPSAPELADVSPVVSAAVILPDAARVPVVQDAPVQMAALDSETSPAVETDATVELSTDCAPLMKAVAGPAASVELTIAAQCHANAPFTIHHQGMMFTTMTDDAGGAVLNVPALAEVSVMIAAFDDGEGAVATVAVPDFANYDRAVLQWQGDASVMLSAYEGDAKFGDSAHIHVDNPGDMARLEAAEGGHLVRLGDGTVGDGLVVEIYTFPTGMIGDAPDVTLVAEAEITANNCGQELNAQSIQVSPDGQTSALDLTMIMPECDAVGDFLILQNMFEDLTLASR